VKAGLEHIVERARSGDARPHSRGLLVPHAAGGGVGVAEVGARRRQREPQHRAGRRQRLFVVARRRVLERRQRGPRRVVEPEPGDVGRAAAVTRAAAGRRLLSGGSSRDRSRDFAGRVGSP
jgi:hypothetical protein